MQIQLLSRTVWLSCLCAIWIVQPQGLMAQGSSLFTGSGTTRGGTGGISGTLGGSGFGTLTGGTSGSSMGSFGSAFGAAAGGRGATGSTGFGATGLGANSFGNSGFGATGMNGANGMGFVGRNGTTMAGNAQAGQINTNGRSNSRSTSNRNFASSGNQNSNQFNNGSNNGANQRTGSSIRPRQRIAFDYNTKSPVKIVSTVSARFERIGTKNPGLRQINVEVVGDDVVLRGKVRTIDQAKLAENLVRFEPGVKSVKNEIEVEEVSVIE